MPTEMPVRSERGLVGRVLEAGRGTARVLLLTDSQSVVPVRLARADVAAFAEGRGDGLIQIRLINLGINPIRKGDLLVTSAIHDDPEKGPTVLHFAVPFKAEGVRRLDTLVVTHQDNDHSGGAEAVLTGIPVDEVRSSLSENHPARLIAGYL